MAVRLLEAKIMEKPINKPIANKTLLETYLMVLDRLKPSKSMCNVAFLLYKGGEITHDDYIWFSDDIQRQAQIMGGYGVYWYARNRQGCARRIEYLKRRISELETFRRIKQ
jgi:hypothetical protein